MIRILFFLFIIESSLASILPENNLVIPLRLHNEGLTEEQYNAVITKVETIYSPIILKEGKKLIMNKLWADPRVNAGTFKQGNNIVINLYGGYARHPLVTEDGYALVICHEIGHHLGGLPRKIFQGNVQGWPATEGQADYFATLKCLRKVFRSDDNIAITRAQNVSPSVLKPCSIFKRNWERAICVRTTIAGIAIAAISADVRRENPPSVETPDLGTVEATFDAHPDSQCRLDTYFQGSICQVNSTVPVSDKNEVLGTCHPSKKYLQGMRPTCWFKPTLQ